MDVDKDGRSWRIGTADDVAWIAGHTTDGLTVTAAISALQESLLVHGLGATVLRRGLQCQSAHAAADALPYDGRDARAFLVPERRGAVRLGADRGAIRRARPSDRRTRQLNRAIAIAKTKGTEAGLRLVDQFGLDDFRYPHSTMAELLRLLGRTDDARDAYRRAGQLTDNGAERRFLDRRLTELAGTTGTG